MRVFETIVMAWLRCLFGKDGVSFNISSIKQNIKKGAL